MNDSRYLDTRSRSVDSCSTQEMEGRMSTSVATAEELTRGLGEMLAPQMPTKSQIEIVYRELSKLLPEVSRRRVRAFFFGEVARVDYEEMRALEELRALEEARREQREFDAATNRLAIALASEGASFTRAQLAALERIKGKTAAGAGGKPFVSSPAGSRPGIAHRYVAASGARKAA